MRYRNTNMAERRKLYKRLWTSEKRLKNIETSNQPIRPTRNFAIEVPPTEAELLHSADGVSIPSSNVLMNENGNEAVIRQPTTAEEFEEGSRGTYNGCTALSTSECESEGIEEGSGGAYNGCTALSTSSEGESEIEENCMDTSTSIDDDTDAQEFKNKLVAIIHKHNIARNFTDDLLKILIDHGHSELPRTARTLLGSKRSINVIRKSSMDYVYFGFGSLKMQNIDEDVEELEISLNIDGLPLFKSSKVSAWPILCQILNFPNRRVFAVAFAVGESKPSDLTFLHEAIVELRTLLKDGTVLSGGRHVRISLKAIVCDAPAKAMIKAVKQFSGFYGCDKCEIKGEYFNHRMTYPNTDNLQLRTNDSFRLQSNILHHTGVSPFTSLETVDMIDTFPIDYMHSVCLGVMRKLITSWVKGVPTKIAKLSRTSIAIIGEKVASIRKSIPSEFARRPRNLTEIDRWKATELRLFLLYTGRFLLKGVLDEVRYKHFIKLSIAIRILTSSSLTATHSEYASQLLYAFVRDSKKNYGQEFMTYNIHSLLHLAKDAKHHGNLENCSAFAFENHLHIIKGLVRNGNRPIVQMTKRVLERESYANENLNSDISTAKCELSTKFPNNIYLSSNQTRLYAILRKQISGTYVVREYFRLGSTFTLPCDSKIINIYTVNPRFSKMRILRREQLGYKCIQLVSSPSTSFVVQALMKSV